jgi:hypothetical protein
MPRVARRLVRFGVACVLVGCAVACESKPGEHAESEVQKNPDATSRPEAHRPEAVDLQALRALPYAGGSEIGDEPDGVDWDDTDLERMYPGYTLMSIHPLSRAILVDERGRVVHEWSDPKANYWAHVELTRNGDLIGTGMLSVPGGQERYIFRLGWDGSVRWKRQIRAHHDMIETPSGDLVTIVAKMRRIPEIHATIRVRVDEITRLTPEGEVIESVSLYRAALQAPELFPLEMREISQSTVRIDLFHTNSVEWTHRATLASRHPIFAAGNVLICSRHQNRLAVVNLRDKCLVWAWGADELDGPHDGQVLENGNLLVFDNGLARGWSRVLEVDPLTGEIVWEYHNREDPADFYTPSRGAAQRLGNGNTLITESDEGHVFEIAPDETVVWRYYCPERTREPSQPGVELRAAIERARRYDRERIESLIALHSAPTSSTRPDNP